MSDQDPSQPTPGPDDTASAGTGGPAGTGAAGTADGMSPGVRFAIIVAAILALVLGWWAVNRGGDPDTEVTASPSATTTATPTPTTSPTATATATPTPTPTTAPTTPAATTAPTTPPPTAAPTTPPAVVPAPGSLVVATRDGVVVVDGATSTPVPGITGPVALAFADGDGAIVAQVDETAITRVVAGTATEVVQVDDFPSLDADGTRLTATAIRLMDVDATTDRMVFTVEYLDGARPSPDMLTQSIVAATDGSDRQLLRTDELFEGSIEHALGGPRRATNLASESSGEVLVVEDDEPLALDWDASYDFVAGDSTILRAPQLDDTGARMALTTIDPDGDWGVRIVDTVSGSEEFSDAVPRDTVTVDLTASSLVTWDGTTSTVVDLDAATSREVTGRATIAR